MLVFVGLARPRLANSFKVVNMLRMMRNEGYPKTKQNKAERKQHLSQAFRSPQKSFLSQNSLLLTAQLLKCLRIANRPQIGPTQLNDTTT
jgi:hypothetical protein